MKAVTDFHVHWWFPSLLLSFPACFLPVACSRPLSLPSTLSPSFSTPPPLPCLLSLSLLFLSLSWHSLIKKHCFHFIINVLYFLLCLYQHGPVYLFYIMGYNSLSWIVTLIFELLQTRLAVALQLTPLCPLSYSLNMCFPADNLIFQAPVRHFLSLRCSLMFLRQVLVSFSRNCMYVFSIFLFF